MLGDGADIRNNCGKLALTSPTKETNNLLKKMFALVIFRNPSDLNDGIAELIEHGFDAQYLNVWIDEGTPKAWVNAWIICDLDEETFCDWVKDILYPVGGYVYGIVDDSFVTGLPNGSLSY